MNAILGTSNEQIIDIVSGLKSLLVLRNFFSAVIVKV